MEVEAATAALQWVSMTEHQYILILTDSQSMLQKIEAGMFRPEWRVCLDNSKVRKITWIYTPGHAGVKGNERADELAGNAPVRGDLSMGLKEVLIALKEQCETARVSDTRQRVAESGYEMGAGRTEHFSGVRRCRLNQLRTGLISLPTLHWLLNWRAEHIWVCPECDEADP